HPPLPLRTVPSPPVSSTLSLHDALPIFLVVGSKKAATFLSQLPLPIRLSSVLFINNRSDTGTGTGTQYASNHSTGGTVTFINNRSEEHTSELQSRENLVCRLLLETKNNR